MTSGELGEEYYIGVFLVGAYQETLGDLHNLFGDTNVVSVQVDDDGSYEFTPRGRRAIRWPTSSAYVEYDLQGR